MIALAINFCRHLAGSSFRPRVKFCQEPARGIFQGFSLSPVLSLPAAHASNVARVSCHERQSACKG